MPGVVKQWTEAYAQVERAAESDGQHWDVRQALNENLQIAKQSYPDRFHTFKQQIDHAVTMTLGEIRDNTVMRDDFDMDRYMETRNPNLSDPSIIYAQPELENDSLAFDLQRATEQELTRSLPQIEQGFGY